jgi:hypothetical protein
MKKLLAVTLLHAILGVTAAGAAPNLIDNGDFELPGGGPGLVPGWTYTDGDAYYGVDADYIGSPNARPGLVFYDGAATNIGLLSQIVDTTTGTSYRLEFDLQRYASTSTNPVDNFATIYFGGLTVFQQEDVAGDWTHFIVDGLIGGAGASTTLTFGNWNTWDFNQLDNITLVATDGPNDVPEPATALTLAAGLGALAMLRRRRPR